MKKKNNKEKEKRKDGPFIFYILYKYFIYSKYFIEVSKIKPEKNDCFT